VNDVGEPQAAAVARPDHPAEPRRTVSARAANCAGARDAAIHCITGAARDAGIFEALRDAAHSCDASMYLRVRWSR